MTAWGKRRTAFGSGDCPNTMFDVIEPKTKPKQPSSYNLSPTVAIPAYGWRLRVETGPRISSNTFIIGKRLST